MLESTTYPGTTREVLRPILERDGLVAGRDFHLAMSPERIDPGRTDFTVRTTPKVVGGLTPACLERALALYGPCIEHLVPVSSCDAAELTKLLENIFRSVNIALVNELAMLCDRMGLNVWEVVAAAATKPYGFMPFQPGPGLGGHCLPIDPFYLAWKAREFDFPTEFIELAGKVNQHMPYYCAERIARALNGHRKAVAGSTVLVLGVAYKGDVGDLRESPALKLIELLRERGADVAYHDPFVPTLAEERARPRPPRRSPTSSCEAADIVCVVTAHSGRRLRPGGRAGAARDRLPKRGARRRRQGGEAVSERVTVGMVGLGGWGKNLLRNFGTLPESDLRWCCDADADDPRGVRGRPIRRPGSRRATTSVLADPDAARRGAGDARADPLRARPAGDPGRQARHGREADDLDGRRGPRAARPRVGQRPRADGRPPAALPSRHREAARADRLRRAGRGALRVRQPAQPGHDPPGRERALVARRARHLGRSCTWSTPTRSRSRPAGECYVQPGVEDVVFGYIRFATGQIGHLHLSWLDPHKMRKMTVVGSSRMAVFDDMEPDRKVTVYDKGDWQIAGRPDLDAHRRHLDAPDRHARAAAARVQPLPARGRAAGSTTRAGVDEGVRVVEVLEAMQTSLDRGGETIALGAAAR